MSTLNEEAILTLSRLCQIEVKEDEIPILHRDLQKILDYIALLQEVDISDLPAYSHIDEQGVGSLRDDEVKDILTREAFLANAPDKVGGMVKVPPVMKQP